MTATATTVEPALYCGTYAKYNDGSIGGKWLRLTDYPDAEAFLQACRELHRDEADPEFMFQDFEGFPKELYSESLSPDELNKLYDWVNLSHDDRELLAEYLDATGYPLADVNMVDVQDKLFCVLDRSGFLSDEGAMGWHVIDEGLVEVPEHLRGCIDAEALGRDWLMDFSVSSNGYVFGA
jgi:antirestriction protein